MKNFLNKIVSLKKKEIEILKAKMPISHFMDIDQLLKGVRPFKDAISYGQGINLIGEIKKKSPTRKSFFRRLDIKDIALKYKSGGARALSVLTDKKYFGGDILHINMVRQPAGLPVLRKDFIIDEYQVYESRFYGADAIILIARILTLDQIKSFIHLAKKIGMDSLLEIHDEIDLEKACMAEPEIIGVNNRDLDTFEISLETSLRIIPKIPKGIIKVSESGIKNHEELIMLRKIGINAVLIGGAFLESGDITGKIKEIIGEDEQ